MTRHPLDGIFVLQWHGLRMWKKWVMLAGLVTCFQYAVAAQREFSLSGKDELAIAVPCEVRIEQGAAASLIVEAPSDVLDALRLAVTTRSATLEAAKNFKSKERIKVRVTMPSLVKLTLSSAVEASLGRWKVGRIGLVLDGSSQMRWSELVATEVRADIQGASGLVISAGDAPVQTYRLDGVGSLDTKGLQGQSIKISISGSGEATVNAKKDLQVDISGVGTVRYAGKPKIQQQINGVGSVEAL
jgi:hypothetical protein